MYTLIQWVILFCRGAGSPGQHSDDLAGDGGALLHRRQENRHRRLHLCGTNIHVGHRGVRSHFQCHVSIPSKRINITGSL